MKKALKNKSITIYSTLHKMELNDINFESNRTNESFSNYKTLCGFNSNDNSRKISVNTNTLFTHYRGISESTQRNDNETNTNDNDTNTANQEFNINIFRYKFTNDFTNELYKFSKIHQYDHRKDFKEAWEKWIEENDDIIDEEIRRLTNLGYDGDILDKMFKSARYYFRKKSTEKKEPSKRRIYVGSRKDFLESMDNHIKSNMNSGNFKPSDGFDDFCRTHIDLLKEQVNQFIQSGITDSNEIKYKIKKTYKNRYFQFITK
jgi:hypothetical protein